MYTGIGTDLISIARIEKSVRKDTFIKHVYTPREQELLKLHRFAAADNWAAKEAVAKALGTGFNPFTPIDIEVLRDDFGKPYVVLHGEAKRIADEHAITNIQISITNEAGLSLAVAIAEGATAEGSKAESSTSQSEKENTAPDPALSGHLCNSCANSLTDYSFFAGRTLSDEILGLFPERPVTANKGTMGKVLIIAGSYKMAGAAVLSAKAAYNCGAGLVRVYTDIRNREIIQTCLPEALFSDYSDDLIAAIKWADTVVVGPGLGSLTCREIIQGYTAFNNDGALNSILPSADVTHGFTGKNTAFSSNNIFPGASPYGLVRHYLTRIVLENASCPVIIDADAIQALAHDSSLAAKAFSMPGVILTPHVKEMADLAGGTDQLNSTFSDITLTKKSQRIMEAIKTDAELFSKEFMLGKNCTLVLKDSTTHTCAVFGEPIAYANTSGCAGMATGGSGDVLTGVIGALCARISVELRRLKSDTSEGRNEEGFTLRHCCDCARLGVYLHGLAGELAAARRGNESMLAGDIAEALSDVLFHIAR